MQLGRLCCAYARKDEKGTATSAKAAQGRRSFRGPIPLHKAVGGDDTISGKDGNDFLAGDEAFEQTLRVNDKVYGGAGNDELEGNQDNDLLVGGPGNDKLNPLDGQQPGTVDIVKGGSGDDDVFANDGNVDIVNCGGGKQDIVRYDVGIDTIKNCEVLIPSQ